MARANIQQRLAQLGISLPPPAVPAGAYVPFVISGSLLLVAGQLPMRDGAIVHHGRIGGELTVEAGIAAARLCGLNLLAQACAACGGDLGRVQRVLRLAGFVQAVPGFGDHPKVLNGASDLVNEVFGERGRHTRTALGHVVMPLDAAVMIGFWAEV